MLDFRILGPLEVFGEQGAIRLGGRKQRATLAILLLGANRVVSVDRLADDLYRGAAPATAVTQVQRQVSELRKSLGSERSIETRPPGYVLRLLPGQLDLSRFERLTADAAAAGGNTRLAADLLREALGLWRGEALADLADEPFAQTAIRRIEEIRLAALEDRFAADLALGRHVLLVPELESTVVENPLREGFVSQLMLALYRSGRQTEALDVYRRTRETLVDEFGMEPGTHLHERQRAILRHDAALDLVTTGPVAAASARDGAVLVVTSEAAQLETLLAVAAPLARSARELIVARLLRDEHELGAAASALNAMRGSLDVETRTAAFTTGDAAADVIRLAQTHDAKLVLLDAPRDLDASELPAQLAVILDRSPADVGVFVGREIEWQPGACVFVPFGGAGHDWKALEVAAWLAAATGSGLRLIGTGSDRRDGRRDASRLLADATLAVQRLSGVSAEPLLVEPTTESLLTAVGDATLVVVGLSPRWRQEGLGLPRRALVARAPEPTLVVHRGLRPGGLSPPQSGTRFTWTIEARSPAR